MKTQNTNPAEDTRAIELTYMEARRLREILQHTARVDSELAASYLTAEELPYAQTSAKKWAQVKTILSKIETIL